MLTFPVRTMPSIFPCLKSCIGLPRSNATLVDPAMIQFVSLEMERHRAGFQKEYLKFVGEGLTSVMSGEMEKPHQRTSARYRNHRASQSRISDECMMQGLALQLLPTLCFKNDHRRSFFPQHAELLFMQPSF